MATFTEGWIETDVVERESKNHQSLGQSTCALGEQLARCQVPVDAFGSRRAAVVVQEFLGRLGVRIAAHGRSLESTGVKEQYAATVSYPDTDAAVSDVIGSAIGPSDSRTG